MAHTDGPRQRHLKPSSYEELSTKSNVHGLGEEDAIKKASGGWIKSFAVAFIISIILPFIVLAVLPSPIEPVKMDSLPTPPALTGPLAVNTLLQLADTLYTDQLSGPESIEVDGDHIYTGASDGWVYHIHKGSVEKLVTFGTEPCGGTANEVTCGRPLGLRMGNDGLLVVIDAYHGLYKVNVVTGDVSALYSSNTPVNGRTCKFLNDLDIDAEGNIYFTDSSSRWHRNQFTNLFLEGSKTGRLLMYSPRDAKVTQLMDGLMFANGVQLTRDHESVLVADTMAARIYKYELQTSSVSVWADNLPGTPDNIRYCRLSGTYWVGLATVRQGGKKSVIDSLTDQPWLRGILSKVLSVNNFPLVAKYLSSADTRAIALEMSADGKILRTLQDATGSKFTGISQVTCADGASGSGGVLYFGSFHAKFIGRLYKKSLRAT